VDESDSEDLGVLIVLLMSSVFVFAVSTVVMEVNAVRQWMGEVKFAQAAVERESEFQPSLQNHVILPDELKLGKILGQGAEGMVRQATYAGLEVSRSQYSVQ
jgi:hypothetical protein